MLSQFAVGDERCHGPLVFISISSETAGVTFIFLTLFTTFYFLIGKELSCFVDYRGQIVLLQELRRV